jgi:starch phosphorylase
LTAQQVEQAKRDGYRPSDYVKSNDELSDVFSQIAQGRFSRGDPNVFRPLVDSLLQFDPFLVLADFADYVACQQRVSDAWQDARRWTRMSIMNTARSGKFSSDRAIGEYCERIWNARAVRIDLEQR